MSAEEPGLSAASCCMETPTLHAWPRDEGEEEEERDEECSYEETKEPQRSSSEESDESEAEPPSASAIRRKVSFADAFGLDLVSVKEFDSRGETGPNDLERLLGVEAREGEEYYLSCFFTVPSSDDELSLLLQQNKLELESIELLPGSTTIRGIIRVLNLSYHKTIYVRTTLDGWQSHFDLLAEYMPGSSDGQTDRFTFQLILVPPFQAEGARLEFCLRYESSTGTFWSNNAGMNYVLLCRHRGGRDLKENEGEKEREAEESNHKGGKKSCLKASRRWSSADLKSKGTSSDLPEPESCRSEESETERIQPKVESRSRQPLEECRKTLVERRNRRRTARLARAQDYFSQREPEATEGGLKVAMAALQLSPPMELDTSGVFQEHDKKDLDTPPILTYHQIPLLSLDWVEPTDSPSHLHTVEISNEKGLDAPENQATEEKSTGSSTDAWEAFLNGTDSSDVHANAVDQECLLRVASLPSHPECETSIPGEIMLSVQGVNGESRNAAKTPLSFTADETLESDLAERWQDFGSAQSKEEALGYKHAGKPGITSETCIGQELVWDHPGSGTQIRCSETSIIEDVSLLETNRLEDATECRNSEEGHGVTREEGEGSAGSLGTEEEVKGDINEVAHNTLTFTRIRDEPLTIRHMGTEGPLGRLYTDEELAKEHISEEYDAAESPEDLIVGLKSGKQGELLGEQNTEIIECESMVLDEEESDPRTEGSDREASKPQEEKVPCHKPGEAEEIPSEAIDNNAADRECKVAEVTVQKEPYEVDEVILGRKSKSDTCKDFITEKEPHKPHRTTDIYTGTPTLSITSHAIDTPGPLSWTESLRESEPLLLSDLHKDPDFGENLEELQDPEAECSAPLSRMTTPSVCTMSSRLLEWWAEFCSLGHVSKALLYAVLFVIFITAYLHDLPVCLAIYLLSMCWWCGQGMKKRVATADSVD